MYKHKPWLRFAEGTEGGNASTPGENSPGENGTPPDDPQEPEGGSGGSGGGDNGDPKLSHDDALKELERVRREAARYRTERNELREKAEKPDEGAGSELKDALARIDALEAEKKTAEKTAARATVSAATGVPAEFIHGDTEEQMTEYATRLKESMTPAGATGAAGKPGREGSPGQAGTPKRDTSQWLAELRNKK